MDRNVRAGYGKHLLCYCRIIIEHHQSVNVVPALHVRVHKAPLNTKRHFYTKFFFFQIVAPIFILNYFLVALNK